MKLIVKLTIPRTSRVIPMTRPTTPVTPENATICEVCSEPFPQRIPQVSKARVCQPSCAKKLAKQEHPELYAERARKEDVS